MKKILVFLILVTLLPLTQIVSQISYSVYWTSPIMSMDQARVLAANPQINQIIMDFENAGNNRSVLDYLKKNNPKIDLIAYSNPQELFEAQPVDNRPIQNSWAKEILQNRSQWLLKSAKGEKIVFYPGMIMLNMSSSCPRINGQTYAEWIADSLNKRVLADPIWDGHFYDNGGGTVSWVNPGIDANRDGYPDDSSVLDKSWYDGIHLYLSKIREANKGKRFVMIANKGSNEFMDILDGRMFEDWPNDYLGDKTDYGWWQCLANAHYTGRYTILQVQEKNLDFAIATAMLLDECYIAVGHNSTRLLPPLPTIRPEDKGEIIISRRVGDKTVEIIPVKKIGKISTK